VLFATGSARQHPRAAVRDLGARKPLCPSAPRCRGHGEALGPPPAGCGMIQVRGSAALTRFDRAGAAPPTPRRRAAAPPGAEVGARRARAGARPRSRRGAAQQVRCCGRGRASCGRALCLPRAGSAHQVAATARRGPKRGAPDGGADSGSRSSGSSSRSSRGGGGGGRGGHSTSTSSGDAGDATCGAFAAGPLGSRDWSAQAADPLAGLPGAGRYKSLALHAGGRGAVGRPRSWGRCMGCPALVSRAFYCSAKPPLLLQPPPEVRLAEALERCGRAAAPGDEWDSVGASAPSGGAPPATSGIGGCTATAAGRRGGSSGGSSGPNRLRTAVCCQLLGELADIAGPLGPVLATLRGELVAACYSGLYAPEPSLVGGCPSFGGIGSRGGAAAESRGGGSSGGGGGGGARGEVPGALNGLRPACGGTAGTLVFEQLPWHSVAARLRRENAALGEEQAVVRGELAAHQVQQNSPPSKGCRLAVATRLLWSWTWSWGAALLHASCSRHPPQEALARVEQQLVAFQAAMDAAEAGAGALRAANAALAASEARSASDVAAAATEARRLAEQASCGRLAGGQEAAGSVKLDQKANRSRPLCC
jgi:hypothetical protein